MNDQKTEVISIASVEDVGWGVKLKNDKGMTFNVPKMLKDQSAETKAWQVLKNLQGYGMGTQQTLQYVETPNSQGGTSRYVRMIIAGQSAPQAPQAPQTYNKPIPAKEEKTDWDKISWGKCKYGFLVEAFKNGASLQDAEKNAEAWADAAMRKINYGEVNLDQIPF